MLAYFSPREQMRGKISPARELLFSVGHHMHEYVVNKFIQNSEWGPFVYASWGCGTEGHMRFLGTRADALSQVCADCAKPLDCHNEISLELPNLMLVGHPDLVILYKDRYYIREFKTWERKDIPFDDITVALATHRLQISFYYKMLWAKALKEGRKVSKKLIVDYIDRSNSKLFGGNPYKPIAFAPESDEDLRPFKNRLLHAVRGIETKKLPPRICPDITCTRARNCGMAVECFARRSAVVDKVDYRRGLCAA